MDQVHLTPSNLGLHIARTCDRGSYTVGAILDCSISDCGSYTVGTILDCSIRDSHLLMFSVLPNN
jgi:hypothetical protein